MGGIDGFGSISLSDPIKGSGGQPGGIMGGMGSMGGMGGMPPKGGMGGFNGRPGSMGPKNGFGGGPTYPKKPMVASDGSTGVSED